MNNLDKRLVELLDNYAVRIGALNWVEDRDKVLPVIKQAFTDAGYVSPDNAKKVQEMINHMANLANDMALLGTMYWRVGNKAMTKAENLMTGQEWYDKFEKELSHPQKQVYASDDEGRCRFYRAGGEQFMYDRSIEAAKKASGIK